MNASSVALVALTLVLILWIGLSIARKATTRYFQRVAAAYAAYHQAHSDEPDQMPPPAMWDFEKGRLVPIPPEEIVADSSSALSGPEHVPYAEAQPMQAHLIREEAAQPVPLWVLGLAYGKKLARISPLWFHGVFAGLTVVLSFLVWKLRAG